MSSTASGSWKSAPPLTAADDTYRSTSEAARGGAVADGGGGVVFAYRGDGPHAPSETTASTDRYSTRVMGLPPDRTAEERLSNLRKGCQVYLISC
jgi:hypothetical protein